MRYILDLTEISEKSRLYGLKIQCKTGLHSCDLDIDECDLPREYYQKRVRQGRERGNNMELPIGIDFSVATSGGAKLIRIEE